MSNPAAAAELERVYELVEAAFAGMTLGGGIGLHEARGLDDYADDATRAVYRASDEREDWHRLTAEELNFCSSSLSFFDAEGMRFHLPAFLLAELRGEYECGSVVFHLAQSFHENFGLLSPTQRTAIRAFLRFVFDDPDYRSEWPDIFDALHGYWAEGDSGPDQRDA